MASRSGSGDRSDSDAEFESNRSSRQSSRSSSAKRFLAPDDQFSEAGRSRDEDDEEALKWRAWERLPSYDRLRTTVLSKNKSTGGEPTHEHVDVREAGPELNKALLDRLFKRGPESEDNRDFLVKIRNRLDKVDLKLPTVEVRFENLTLEAQCRIGDQFLPTLTNTVRNMVDDALNTFNLSIVKKRYLTILHEVSGILKPGRMCLLLGPPGGGKTSLLLALAASLEHGVEQRGSITYNGHTFDEFVPKKTSAYVGQNDAHSGEFTVRETLDYASRYQGVGSRYDLLSELVKREKELGIHPDPDVDLYMKTTALESVSHDLFTEYIMKILGLDICADTVIGDDMRRGISGGQKKRVTTAELLVGPSRTLFMDEISNGLDSSTAFQIVTCLGQFTHLMDMTILIALLQPAPEIFELFDDIILLTEGQIAYHGPRENVEEFFASCGFRCPPRKGIADFLQEVTSRKDQEQYWVDKSKPYKFVPVRAFSDAYKKFHVGVKLHDDLAIPYDKSKSHRAALAFQQWPLSQKDLFKITFGKEVLFLKRNSFIYVFKTSQMMIQALIIATVFFRTKMHRQTFWDAQIYLGAIFENSITVMFSGFADVILTVVRLPIFYKQRDMRMVPAWTFALSTLVTRLPFSLVEATLFVAVTYYPMGFAPSAGRFFKLLLIYIVGHQMASSLFRMIAGLCRTLIVATSLGSLALCGMFCLGGFLLPRSRFKDWWIWGYWASPLSWTLIGVSENEFLAPQWNKQEHPLLVEQFRKYLSPTAQSGENYRIHGPCSFRTNVIFQYIPGSTKTLGRLELHLAGLYPHGYWYWIAIGVVVLEIFLFNFIFSAALTYLRAPRRPQAVISEAALAESEANRDGTGLEQDPRLSRSPSRNSISKSQHFEFARDDKSESSTEDSSKAGLERTTSSASGSARPSTSSIRSSLHTNREAARAPAKRGMVLPFQPLSISFNNVSYFVDMPAEMKQRGATEDKLQLLRDITGAFRPGVLTALVGVTGAGKSTLMDVLSGRKTRGTVEGDIHISGFPKVQETFARVSGYCEQNDLHSPKLTIFESLTFSAWLRLQPDVTKETRKQFIEEVMELVELSNLRNAIVGLPAMSGLSTEQRKRLTIAVELVANPSIIFMDEPTSGLDARAAAIVMRAVRNTVDTGRTVVCTIHQPSIDIFESFDELLLLKAGGQVTFAGPLGQDSQKLVKYFQDIPGIPHIKDGSNPATWVLEVTTRAMERKLGVDFTDIYKNSSLFERNKALVEELSEPAPGTETLYFSSQYAQSYSRQLWVNLWKQNLTYWRSPDYNNVRYIFTIMLALFFGTMYWHVGQKRSSQFNIVEVMGGVYAAGLLIGILVSITVQPVIATERTVFYREHAAGMYAAIPYALSQILIEVPYTFGQALLYSSITYSAINLEWKADKFFLYLYFTFFITLNFSFYGMMTVALTPNVQFATVLSAFFVNIWGLFSGFIINKPRIPVWWSWYYWANPLAWHVYGTMVSQFGDLDDKFVNVVGQPGSTMSIQHFLRQYFGFRHNWLGFVTAMNFLFPILFALVYVVAIKYINFQNR